MINNFLCDKCTHFHVCEKMKSLMKFHDSAKKDLMITITMESCLDFENDPTADLDAVNEIDEDDEEDIEDDDV